VIRLEGQRAIVRFERLPVPLEVLEDDALPRPSIGVARLLLEGLLVPEQSHLGIAALHRELRELQEDLGVLPVGLD